ncbi:MAG: hypothetical protein ACK2U1_05210 [Anaerolineales bacterium]|jgi:hypothetical protein
MDANSFLWGLVMLAAGIFVCSYGNQLFRFVLAFIGFAIGFSLVMWLGDFLSDGLQIVIGLIFGGILAAVFYLIIQFALHIAGGLLGLVIMLAILGMFKMGGLDLGFFGWILALIAAGVGVVFGKRLGDLVIVLATALTGAYFVVVGLAALFGLNVNIENPEATLGTGFALILFLTIALISGLTQYQAFSVRKRLLR